MKKHYVTFGQVHTHSINGHTLDKDCVAVYSAKDSEQGRRRAFQLFGDKFFTDYHGEHWDESFLHYFPRGYIDIDKHNMNGL